MRKEVTGRRKIPYYDKGPGPAAYKLPKLTGRKNHAVTHKINPEFSFGLMLKSSFITPNQNPGPAYYDIQDGVKSNGKFLGYFYSLRKKLPYVYKEQKPGPGAYTTNNFNKPRPPSYVFGIRPTLLKKSNVPAPNKYAIPPALGPKIPDKLAAPAVSLKGSRKKQMPTTVDVPFYACTEDERKPGGISFGLKLKTKDTDQNPSPAHYYVKGPKCNCKTTPGPHLGVRYNDFTGIFMTPCDRVNYNALD